jgi:S-adenosylmethionine hydrolase
LEARGRPLLCAPRARCAVDPDNGVLSWTLREEAVEEARSLTNSEWFLEPVSQISHGRDIFAPVAARLSLGAAFSEIGELIDDFVRLPWPEVDREENRIRGEEGDPLGLSRPDQFGRKRSGLGERFSYST